MFKIVIVIAFLNAQPIATEPDDQVYSNVEECDKRSDEVIDLYTESWSEIEDLDQVYVVCRELARR